jgi:hypothetical protein
MFKSLLRLLYIGDVFMAISPATVTRDSHYLLALATLGKVTEIEIILIAKVSNEGDIASQYRGSFFYTNLANVNKPL